MRKFCKRYTTIFMIIFIVLVGFFNLTFATVKGETAKIVEFEGKVKITKKGGEKTFNAFKGMSLVQGDKIETGKKAFVKIEIGDTKEIKVGDETSISFSQLVKEIETKEEKTKINLASGKVWVNVKQKLKDGSKVEVKTPTAVMGVRGTEFYVNQDKSKVAIVVLEGVVSAKTKENKENVAVEKEILIAANEQLSVENKEIKKEIIIQENLDLFLLQTIKENPERVDPKLLENINDIIQKKKENQQKAEKNNNDIDKKENEIIKYEAEENNYTETSTGGSGNNNTIRKIPVSGVSLDQTSVTDLEVGDLSVLEKRSVQLVATVSPIDATNKGVTWETSDATVATVDSNGLVNTVGAGNAVITVRTADGSYTASCNITVTAKNTIPIDGVSLDQTSVTDLEVGDLSVIEKRSVQLVATISPIDATNKGVTWETSDATVATVDSNGLVHTVGAGNAVITVRTADGNYTASCNIIVTAKESVNGIKLNQTALTVGVGKNNTLTATISPEGAVNKNVVWRSVDENIATVVNGVITGVNTGTTTIEVQTEDGGFIASSQVTVIIPVMDITLEGLMYGTIGEELKDMQGSSDLITVTVKPDNATDKTYTMSIEDPTIATIKESNNPNEYEFNFLKRGSTLLRINTNDGNMEKVYRITVTKNIPILPEGQTYARGISVDQTSVSINKGESTTIIATVEPDEAYNKNVIWKSMDESIATVENGVITGVGEGTTTIEATTEDTMLNDVGYTAIITVEVTRTP